MQYDVAVIGGGLAGCSAAIRCRSFGYSVILIEKGRYPRTKLCGEFLSPEVQRYFTDLDVMDAVRQKGAVELGTVLLSSHHDEPLVASLPGRGIGLSRYALDLLLSERAREVGADVHLGTTVNNVSGKLGDYEIVVGADKVQSRTVLVATGRSSRLAVKLGGTAASRASPFVAFKAHYRGVDLEDRIELHAFEGGYCGMSHVEDQIVNVCWISDKRRLSESSNDPAKMQTTIASDNVLLHQRFETMQRISDTFCAASQLTFRPKSLRVGNMLFVGDAAGMIAPLCGDGMAMALRSGELAVEALTKYFDKGSHDIGGSYGRAWRSEFKTRLALGRWLHHGLIRPTVSRRGLSILKRSRRLLPALIRLTRG